MQTFHRRAMLTDACSAPVRCSITSFLLVTPAVRTCIGCTRKALLPAVHLGQGAAVPARMSDSWIVEVLLEACRCCLFCGNRFIRVL